MLILINACALFQMNPFYTTPLSFLLNLGFVCSSLTFTIQKANTCSRCTACFLNVVFQIFFS